MTPDNVNRFLAFKDWLTTSSKGEKYIYYTGFLAEDMMESYEARRASQFINDMCSAKLITVTQKKIVSGLYKSTYDYIAYKL